MEDIVISDKNGGIARYVPGRTGSGMVLGSYVNARESLQRAVEEGRITLQRYQEKMWRIFEASKEATKFSKVESKYFSPNSDDPLASVIDHILDGKPLKIATRKVDGLVTKIRNSHNSIGDENLTELEKIANTPLWYESAKVKYEQAVTQYLKETNQSKIPIMKSDDEPSWVRYAVESYREQIKESA